MSEQINEIVNVAEVEGALYLLVVEYEESDGGNGVGLLYRTDGTRDAQIEPVLSTNDLLRVMWISPSGSIWLSSEGGNVWTTADVGWSAARDPDLSFESYDAGLSWSVTTLPAPKGKRAAPNLGAIWGTDDANVFAAASNGPIYQWDGKAWRQVHVADGTIRAFSGSSPHDVFAVGERGSLVHFDGSAWRALRNPDAARADETFTAALHDEEGSVYVCSEEGRLLHGSASGLNVLAQNAELALRGLAFLGSRLLMAAADAGVVELQGKNLSVIRSTFPATFINAGHDRVFFLDASTETCYIEYDPAHPDKPWQYVSFS